MLMMADSLSVRGPAAAMLGVTSSSVRAPQGRGPAPTAASAAAPSSSVLRSQQASADCADACCLTVRWRACLLWLPYACEANRGPHISSSDSVLLAYSTEAPTHVQAFPCSQYVFADLNETVTDF